MIILSVFSIVQSFDAQKSLQNVLSVSIMPKLLELVSDLNDEPEERPHTASTLSLPHRVRGGQRLLSQATFTGENTHQGRGVRLPKHRLQDRLMSTCLTPHKSPRGATRLGLTISEQQASSQRFILKMLQKDCLKNITFSIFSSYTVVISP